MEINSYDRRPKDMQSSRHINVILLEPQLAGNIGAVARAMANMGLGRLILINPKTDNWELIKANATVHAERVINELEVFSSFEEAVKEYDLLVATTARVGARRGPFYSPRQLAGEIFSLANNYKKVALVFGPERTGLLTQHLRYCQKVVRIPTAESEASSLNLGQAVLILAYELIMAAGGEVKKPEVTPASQEELRYMYEDLSQTLVYIDFLSEKTKEHGIMNIKKIFNRGLLSSSECNLWRGVAKQIRWAVDNKHLDKDNKND